MRLKDKQTDDHEKDRRKGRDAVSEAFHPSAVIADNDRKRKYYAYLCYFRGLQRKASDPYPALRAVCLDAYKRHEQQQHYRRDKERN